MTPTTNYWLDIASAGKSGSIKLDGTTQAVIDNGRNRAIDGTNSVPAYSFYNNENIGMYNRTTGEIGFSCSNAGVVITENRAITPSANAALKLEPGNGSTERMLFCTYLSGSAYNNITLAGDTGIFYGTAPAPYGLVIAPHRNALSGIRLDSNGNVGICNANPTVALDVTGDIKASGNITAFSDERVKTDIRTIENALEKVRNMRGVSYVAKADAKKRIGVIAQEIEKIIPEVVLTDNTADHYKSVDYGNIVAVLIEAVKELSAKVDALSAVGV
jgi:hypothetical protein